MNHLSRVFFLVVSLIALAASPVALAQDAPGCADLEFAKEITDVLPQANQACREVVMKDGEPYARFTAEIVSNQARTVRAKFKRADGTWTESYKFRPDQKARIHIQGQSYRWSEIDRGQQLDVYLPPDRFEIATHEDPNVAFEETAVVVAFVTVERAPREELPTTASLLPLAGALGALFVALGAGIRLFRRRNERV